MKKGWLALILLMFALASAPMSSRASAGDVASGEVHEEPSAGSCTPRGPNSGPGCTGRRWIGYFADGNCAAHAPALLDPTEWGSRPLFPPSDGGDPPLSALSGYCLFTFNGVDKPSPAAISALQSAGLAEDCVTVGGMSPTTDVRQELKAHFWKRVVQVPPQSFPPLDEGRQTAVAVVDTQTNAGHFRDDHGAIVSGLIDDLACADGGPCLVAIDRELGLPHTDNERTDYRKGGSFGTPGQLAEGVYRAVERWKKLNYASGASPDHPRLVVNLSVGWHPGNDCGAEVDALSCSARSVYDVIRYAACEGVLVVAAAGNSPGGARRLELDARAKKLTTRYNPSANIDGGTCPGAWTVIPTPSSDACDSILPANDPVRAQATFPHDDTDPESTPMLVAVTGLDYRDEPLANARAGARPPYAALGVLATTELDALDGDLPPPITGSSIGAAVWSAIAASAWAYSPRKTRGEIIDIVYGAGRPTALVAEMALGGGPTQTRAASLCSVLGISCPDTAPLPTSVPTVTTDLSSFFDAWSIASVLTGRRRPPSEMLQATQALSWVRPQPEVNPCGVCFFDTSESAVLIYVNPEYTSAIQEVTLRDGANTNNAYQFTPSRPLVAGDRLLFQVPLAPSASRMTSPELLFRVQKLSTDGVLLEGSVIAQPFLTE